MKNPIQLPVGELKQALAGLNKVLLRRATLPVFGTIRVTRDDAGTVHLHATDLDSFVTYRSQSRQPGEPVDFLAPADALMQAVKASRPDDHLELMIEAEDTALLRQWIGTKAVDQRHRVPPLEEWPAPPAFKRNAILLDDSFKTVLQEAMECVSQDTSRPVINGALIDTSLPEAHYLVGTNGRVLYAANSFQINLQKPLIVPNQKFLGWAGFLNDGPWTLSVQPVPREIVWFRFRSDNWSYLARAIDGDYPNWRQVEPGRGEFKTRVVLEPGAVEHLLQLLPRVPGNKAPDYALGLAVNDGGVTVLGRDRQDQEPVSIPLDGAAVTGEPVTVHLNREYLRQALRFGLTQFEVVDPLTPVLFSGANKKMVIMPLKSESNSSSPPEVPSPGETATATEDPENTMPEKNRTVPPRGNPAGNGHASGEERPAIKDLIDRIENIKTSMRNVMAELNETVPLLREVMKEQKATEKEVESVRTTLRSLQKVQI